MSGRKSSVVDKKIIVRIEECDILGIDRNIKTSQPVLVYNVGKVVAYVNPMAKRGDILRSIRLLKEEVALDGFLSLDEQARKVKLGYKGLENTLLNSLIKD
jgi:hypothetical protein